MRGRLFAQLDDVLRSGWSPEHASRYTMDMLGEWSVDGHAVVRGGKYELCEHDRWKRRSKRGLRRHMCARVDRVLGRCRCANHSRERGLELHCGGRVDATTDLRERDVRYWRWCRRGRSYRSVRGSLRANAATVLQ